jgi:chemotaxis response regulator CheB
MNNSESGPSEDAASTQSHALPKAPVAFKRRAQVHFPVIGIGASAGGVEALSEFFGAIPPAAWPSSSSSTWRPTRRV